MPTEKVVQLQRRSLRNLVAEIQEQGPKALGVIAAWTDADGYAHFRISGFDGTNATFTVLGLLDWMKADLLADLVP